MAWNYDRSQKRVKDSLIPLDEIEIKPLSRPMDLESLSEKRCRTVFGAHLYADVINFDYLLTDATLAQDGHKRLVRALHVYEQEVTRIVEGTFEGTRVHFQGPKVHAVLYVPVDDASEIATRGALCALTIELLCRGPFSKLFPAYKDFRVSSGLDIGSAVATKNGTRGDRELLFLGNAANKAAKIVPAAGNRIAATRSVLSLIEDDLADLLQANDRTMTDIRDALAASGSDWQDDVSFERMKEAVEAIPLKDISISGATARIDKSRLSIRNNKRVVAASVFGDVAGFTPLIAGAEDEEQYKQLIQWFHLIRKEMREVVVTDFDGVRIQYQGDRIQGLLHLPADDVDAISVTAIQAAAGLQSSMEYVLNEYAPDKKVHLAVGADIGATLASSLGTRGDRDVICIGRAPRRAAAYEDHVEGTETCISPEIHERIPEKWQELFEQDTRTDAWVARGLTQRQLDDIAEASILEDAREVTLRASSAGVGVHVGTQQEDEDGVQYRAAKPTRPWAH